MRNATRSSIPVFSVDTPEEAEAAIARFCLLRYDGSCRWTDWPHDLDPNADSAYEEVDKVTEELKQWWNERHAS